MTPHRVYLDVPMRYPVKLRDNAGICAMDGYVSECGVEIKVETSMSSRHAEGTAPEDTIEGIGRADSLRPQSLYEFQRRRRSADAAAQ
jgi:hypothetical protein